jgi:2,3-bisphosphoglycerate-dependent phosphoglycerate mutase
MNQVFYLVRHCQATGQEPDAPLTDTGKQQAIALADWFSEMPIGRIICSLYSRALQSIMPLSEHLRLAVETDERLVERVLSPLPLNNWRESLAKTFIDLDLSFEGGESSRTGMMRGVAVVNQALQQTANPVVIVTHGNLMTLVLKHFDQEIGFAEWERLQNPDVYCIQFSNKGAWVERCANVDFNRIKTHN